MKNNLFSIIIFLSLLIYISSQSNITNDTFNETSDETSNDTYNNTNNNSSDIYYNHTSLEDNLYFVVTTYRHGARYPFVHVDFFGNGIRYKGHLTNYGAVQHLEIGKKYKERYSNFLDMNFNPKEFYIRSSDVHRTVISTMKQLEALFGKSIGKNYFRIVGYGLSYWNLYTLNSTARYELERYFEYCDKQKRRLPDISEIFPLLQQCYGTRKIPNLYDFCDSVFTSYFEYVYSNRTDNKIGRCGRESADKMYDFCIKTYDEYRGWDERAAYMFYTMYQQLFHYMSETLEGKSPLKMVMIGGHDTTLIKFMDFLDGLKIIPRTHYPHYACNIVIELRKYSDEFYLEFYYNDILKYNETLQTFKDTLDNSKYSNMYNYCGIPQIKTTTIETTNIETTKKEEISTTQNIEETTNKEVISTTQKVEETKNKIIPSTTQKIIEITQTQEIPPSTQTKEIDITDSKEVIIPTPTTNIIQESTKQIKEITQTQKINTIIQETEKVEATIKIEEETDKIKESQNQIEPKNNITNLVQNQEMSAKNSTLKSKIKNFFKKENNLNLFIIIISIIASVFFIILFAYLFKYFLKKKKKFIKLTEEKANNTDKVNYNMNVISVENRKEEKM